MSGQTKTLLDAYDLSEGMDKASDAFASGDVEKIGCSIVFDSITTDGTPSADVYLQASIDGVSWFNTDATNHKVSSADLGTGENLGFSAKDLFYPYLRLNIDGTAITGGTATVKIFAKVGKWQ